MANKFARKLRKAMTPQEVKLWAHLRPLKTQGFKFRRQVPLRGYVVDFACFESRLIVEVDGSHHGVGDQAERDRVRDEVLERGGFVILRFWNVEVDHDFDTVLTGIHGALRNAALRRRAVESHTSSLAE